MSGWQEGLLAAGLTGAPVLVVLATVPDSRGAHTAALIAGVVAGVLLLIAALIFYFYWLTTPSRRHSWTASAMVVLAVQVLASSAVELARAASDRGILPWGSAVDVLATTVVLALMLIGGRALRNPQPLLVGIGLGMALTALHVVGPADDVLVDPSAATAGLLLLTIVVGQLAIAWLVARDTNLTEWARNRLVLTIVLVGIASVARSGAFEGWATDLAAATAQVGAAVLWTSATFVLLRDALATQHRRSIVLEGSVLEFESTLRGSREQLHEIRSTVAGAASASRLLDDHTIGAATHARLERAHPHGARPPRAVGDPGDATEPRPGGSRRDARRAPRVASRPGPHGRVGAQRGAPCTRHRTTSPKPSTSCSTTRPPTAGPPAGSR